MMKKIQLILLIVFLPLIVVVALMVQNLQQKASVTAVIQITDETAVPLSTTSTPFVFVELSLPPNFVFSDVTGYNLDDFFAGTAYAQSKARTNKPKPKTSSTDRSESGIPTPTPTPQAIHVLESIRVENKDSDGSSGGNGPVGRGTLICEAPGGKVSKNGWAEKYPHFPFRLNDLLPSQASATRTVQVTFAGTDGFSVTYNASVVLTAPAAGVPTPSTTFSFSTADPCKK